MNLYHRPRFFAVLRCTLSFVLLLGPAGTPALAAAPVLPTFRALQFHPPKPQRFVLANGLTLFLLEDHELPLIRVQLLVRAGSQYDPADKVGLSGLFGNVLAVGGSEHHTPEDIERTLDATGGGISFSSSLESVSGDMSARSKDFDRLFAVFGDLVMHPLFRKDYVELDKAKSLESLRRMNDEPEDVCRREFRRIMYGKTHPYSRISDPETIQHLKRDDLLALHASYFKPNAAYMAISGDFDSSKMQRTVESVLGSWAKGQVSYPAIPPVPVSHEPGLFFIQRPLNQSQIRIGHLGLVRHSPDHFAWEVFNELWGGGGNSVLFRTVRTQRGLAYSVGSAYSEPQLTGLIVAISQTRGPQTPAAITAIQDITKKMVDAPFTDEEIHSAKESIRNRFVENYGSSAQIAGAIMSNEFLGFPADYIDTYTDHIGQVSRADLRRVAAKHIRPQEDVLLVVGDLSTFDQPLSRFGKPQEWKIPDYSAEAPR